MTPHRIVGIVAALLAITLSLGTYFALSARAGPNSVSYTGCLDVKKGKLFNVAVGDQPSEPCSKNDKDDDEDDDDNDKNGNRFIVVTWNQTGPAGADGPPGADGLNCWDLDGDGIRDPDEDVNLDGNVDAQDCRGPQGEQGPQGDPGDLSGLETAVADAAAHAEEVWQEVRDLEACLASTCGSDVGECRQGVQVCGADGIVCLGSVGPTTEVCDGRDNDCNGEVDEGVCQGGACFTDGDCAGLFSNAFGVCVDATCEPGACEQGFSDCDGNKVANGCETFGPCIPPGPTCSPSETDCNGACTDLTTDPSNCGTCGQACPAGDACQNGACTPATECGNGSVDPGEVCDDGNRNSGDGCNSTCDSDEVCGNSIVDINEQCDDGNGVGGDGCSSTCRFEGGGVCGDGVVDAGEQCDDGNTDGGDGCSSTCRVEGASLCGDGVLQAGEACDDGNNQSGDGCSASCDSTEICGNGIVDINEQCDDDNDIGGDGCSSTCQVETGACVDAADCEDGNPCTDDVCDLVAGCVNTAISCDDGNVCTIGSCDPASGCEFVVAAGLACDDGDACTTNDSCDPGGFCGGAPRDCSDGFTCTTDSCDPNTGQCFNDASTCQDVDGDGFAPPTDCDDTNLFVHPGAAEVCDGRDNDCDPTTPDGTGDPALGVACDGLDSDSCNEGVFQCSAGALSCSDSTGDDVEVCDGADNDCNALVDDNAVDAGTFYLDLDGDGYGDANTPVVSCDPLIGFVSNPDDCNDLDAAVNPAAFETCNNIDDNCDGSVDEGGVCLAVECVQFAGRTYCKVDGNNLAIDTGNEVCDAINLTCAGYTWEDDSVAGIAGNEVCLAFHPGANQNFSSSGDRSGVYCDGSPQGGVCASLIDTCHVCPACTAIVDCGTPIGGLYAEMFVECTP